jgi:hypothetical protein
MNFSEIKNPYCIVGLIIFVIIIGISIYYQFIAEPFTITIPVTTEMNSAVIEQINVQLNTINKTMDANISTNIYSNYLSELTSMLKKRNIHIIEAYPYLPLYGILLYYDTKDKEQFDETAFKQAVEIDLSTNLINNFKTTVNNIITEYIYMLVTYKNYVPYQYVNSSLNSDYILDNDYKTLFEADYIQFIKDTNALKEVNSDIYDLLVKYIYNYNKNIGDNCDVAQIGLTIDIIKSYMDNTKSEASDKYELSKIYTELNYINDYLSEFTPYVENACEYLKETVNIFTITPDPTSTSTTI